MKNKIKKYTQLKGISGSEHPIRKELETVFKNDTLIYKDNLGGIATKILSKNKDAFKLGIFAHMDEVGFIVNKIKDNGNVTLTPVGGISISALLSQRLEFVNQKGESYIGVVLFNTEKKIQDLKVSDLEVCFGLKDKLDAKNIGLTVGSYISFIGEFVELNNNVCTTKAADDRIGCAFIEKLYDEYSKKENNFELTLGATVQEEMGLKGASTLLNKLETDFDQILIVDVSPVDIKKENDLGEGFLLRLGEPRGVYDYEGNIELEQIAKKNNIKYQKFFSAGRTDGAMMQITNIGNKVNAICIPALNLHSNSTVFDMNDVNSGLEMIRRFLDEK